jgi:hypothetical protein
VTEHGTDQATTPKTAKPRIGTLHASAVAQAFDESDVDALYAAAGLEREQPVAEPPTAVGPLGEPARHRRKPEALFSSPA